MTRVLFISSTGGHFAELMQLRPLMDKYYSYIVTEKTSATDYLRAEWEGRISFLFYGTKKNMLTYPLKLVYNTIKSLCVFIKFRPSCVVTTGTHTAVPMCLIAKLCRRRVVYIETMANVTSKTMAGRILYPIADLFIVQWESMLKLYPKAVYGGTIF